MRIFGLFLAAALLFVSVGFCGDSEVSYSAMLISGKKVGHVVEDRRVDGANVTTTVETVMTIGRVGVGMTVKMVEKHIETVDGKAISFEMVQNVGGMPTIISGKVVGDKMEVKKNIAGTSHKMTVDFPEDSFLSEGLRLLSVRKGLTEGTTYKANVFVSIMADAVETDVVVGPKKSVDLFGRVVELTEVKTTMLGEVTTSYVNSEFESLKSITPMMGMELVVIACDKQFALSQDDLVDFLDKTIVKSPSALASGDNGVQGKIVYNLKPTGSNELTVLSSDNQKVNRKKDGTVLVTVDPVKMPDKVKFPYKGKDKEILKMLEPAAYLQSDEKVIIDLAKQAVKGTKDAGEAARNIEAFVGNYISEKNFSVGYASALDVAKSKQGDCTEHAVLTAAMCRSVGIPARIVSGVVYASKFAGKTSVFGGHAWTEVYVGGKWVGLDATRPYGSGHIALSAGSGDPEDFFSMISTIGCFTIETIEF